ncbi:DUF817 domain-containing protein [Bacillus sp. FJAT-47783]|uniref:DUF817 domain-containing protein n=1 Tax=Bacillus sp. FJAT-47783 TaxID=2922712 RepID=UPI001FAD21B4|nr:DUF817 domain-containing protein [Bacillus sp. FJAT-47783]
MKHFINLFYFAYEQAISCLFAVIIFASLAITKTVDIPYIQRYDLILIICILTQIFMILFRIETVDELKVICVFHLIGLALEIFKVHMGSWSYPEEAWSKVLGVPLYSGFMYASVASYMCQAWRRLNLQIHHWPPSWIVVLLCTAIYLNFFTHHFIMDVRWGLKVIIVLVFYRTIVLFTIRQTTNKMPMIASFILIGFFIWIAENIATFFGAWSYPNQQHEWELVHIGKISSWLLLVIVSFLIVAQLKDVKANRQHEKRSNFSI